ncbi:MAG: ASCH domain-containing protein [Methylacidiphilales bacterium]|nr:ASCH domain-containing protein [Candidatus Methylacidiphilales bacterium]
MKVLLSIKPIYANKIFDGKKMFEFRKVIFINPNVNKVIVYASSPTQRVIGEFEIDDIITTNPSELWKKTKKYAGISEVFFYEYFQNRNIAHAIKIKNSKLYKRSLDLQSIIKGSPPQSFLYIK